MTQQEQLRTLICELCFSIGDVAPGLAWYRDEPQQAIQTIARCSDHRACRQRVEQAGQRWPLLEEDGQWP